MLKMYHDGTLFEKLKRTFQPVNQAIVQWLISLRADFNMDNDVYPKIIQFYNNVTYTYSVKYQVWYKQDSQPIYVVSAIMRSNSFVDDVEYIRIREMFAS